MSSGIQGGGDSTSTGLDEVSQAVESASSAFSTGREKSKHYKTFVWYLYKNAGYTRFEVHAVIWLRNHVFWDLILH